MTLSPRANLAPLARRRRHSLILWAVVACVAAVLIEVGAVTDGFGLGGLWHSSSAPSGPSGPNPNPYNEPITAIIGSITYTEGGAKVFPALANASLCVHCPEPTTIDTNYSAPAASVWFYFNITNDGSNFTRIGNFSMTTSGPNASLFILMAIFSCSHSLCDEPVTNPGFPPGITYPFQGLAISYSVPYDGSTGYALTLHATSP